MDYGEKLQRCYDYIEALEQEKTKIQVFQRELPLCLELVTQAIEACKRELSGATASECSEQTTATTTTSIDGGAGTRPPLVLEEFIPIKKTDSNGCRNEDVNGDDDDEEEDHRRRNLDQSIRISGGDQKKKSDWLRSVQLWNQTSPDPQPLKKVKRSGGAFQPFNKEKSNQSSSSFNSCPEPALALAPAASSTGKNETAGGGGGDNDGGGNSRKEEKDGQTQRKQRRCWSPELHRLFLQALQQLGGSHAATPKQIRELMKVDGLTNDEVKSHLQKYRLHTRRPSNATVPNNSNTQLVVVGGIWMPPPAERAAAGATTVSEEIETVAVTGIHSPVPERTPTSSESVAKQQQHAQSGQSHSEGRGSHGCCARSNSVVSSSSTHITRTSTAF